LSTTTTTERRRKSRKTGVKAILRLQLTDGAGHPRWITADLLDRSIEGIAVAVVAPLQVGARIIARGNLRENEPEAQIAAEITWCTEQPNGRYHAGVVFSDFEAGSESGPPSSAPAEPSELDYYEILQVSPNADFEMIHRVYRLLAQRHHPDNNATGDNQMFVRLVEAYSVLGHPERRAKYDASYREVKRLHWKIFDQAQSSIGLEAEKRKRRGILGLLHAKTLHNPEQATMNIFEFEELLGCPREHLQAALWYLRAKGYIQRSDNGRFGITVQGFDANEETLQASEAANPKLIESAARS
jgi:hypothetical protein